MAPDSTAIFGGPSWSPDSTRLTFGSDGGLALIDADGSNLTVLPVDVDEIQETAWSPDGTRIAFSGYSPDTGPYPALFVVGTDGSGLTLVAEQTAGWEGTITWAPDGSELAFAAGPQGE